MTFDESIEHFKNNTDISGTAVFLDDVEDTLKELRDEYAPIIEMTPTEYKIFKSAKIDEDSADWLDEISWGKVDYNYPKFMQAWLHPETIKVVDDERN